MTCSERCLLSQACYGVLHVFYIVFFLLLCFRTAKHVPQMARLYPEWRGIKKS